MANMLVSGPNGIMVSVPDTESVAVKDARSGGQKAFRDEMRAQGRRHRRKLKEEAAEKAILRERLEVRAREADAPQAVKDWLVDKD